MSKECVSSILFRRRCGLKPLKGWTIQEHLGVSFEVSPDNRLVYIDNPSWPATYSFNSVAEAHIFIDGMSSRH